MNVERAQADIRKISLATSITSIVTIRTVKVFIFRELVPRVEHLVCVHDLRALIKVSDRFLKLSCVYLHHTTVQIIVLFIKDIFFVVVGVFCLLIVDFIITFVCTL